jgi:hypothetical protein
MPWLYTGEIFDLDSDVRTSQALGQVLQGISQSIKIMTQRDEYSGFWRQ